MSRINESIPIFVKITEGIKDHILMGDLKEGEQLPSTTMISREYNINIATVNKAVNILVSEGIAFKKRGIGMFVSEGAREKLKDKARTKLIEEHISKLVEEAKKLGIGKTELIDIIRKDESWGEKS